ncbi:MAG: alpha-2-macroglobulin family protein, partial [Elusimicrobiota bacterium]
LRIFCVEHKVESTTGGFEFHVQMREEDEEKPGKYKESKRGWRRDYVVPSIDLNVFREFVSISPGVNFNVRRGEKGYVIVGDFKPETKYEVNIKKGLYSNDGKVLEEDYSFSVRLGDIRGGLEIMSKGHVVPSAYDYKLAVKHTNLKKVNLSVRQIYPQNVTFWLSGRRDFVSARESDLIKKQEIELPYEKNREMVSYLNLKPVLPEDARGIFQIDIRGRKNTRMDRIQIIISDIGLNVKKEKEGVRIWARSLRDLQALGEVDVQLRSYSNKIIAEGSTDSNGFVHFDETPYVVTVSRGDDFNYLPLDEPELKLAERETSGADYGMEFNYRSYIFTDRGVYRPNDRANITLLVRDSERHAPGDKFPLRVEIIDPGNRTVAEEVVHINSTGFAELSRDFGNHPMTGKYTVKAYIGKNNIGSGTFQVEEFVPERLDVSIRPEKSVFVKNERLAYELNADFLFGAPASGADYEAEFFFKPERYSSEKFPGYFSERYYNEEPQANHLTSLDGSLDEEGRAVLRADLALRNIDFDSPVRLGTLASVFEAGSGRSTKSSASAFVLPNDRIAALRPKTDIALYEKETTIEGVVLDRHGEKVEASDELTVEISRVEYDWYYSYNPNDRRYTWNWVPYDYKISEDMVEYQKGEFEINFTPSSSWGAYLVSVYLDGSVSQVFLPARWEWRYMAVRRAARASDLRKFQDPQYIQLDTDRDEYKTGDTVNISFNSRFSGKALFSVESDEVLHWEWIQVKEGRNDIRYKIRDYIPNIYFSLNFLKAIPDDPSDGFEPYQSMGVKSIKVNPYKHKLPLEISAPEKIEPNTEVDIQLSLPDKSKDVYAQVALVDEGILQLTDFKTPSPLDFFFKKCALGVSTYGNYGWLMGRPRPEDLSGGGAESQRARDAALSDEAVSGAERVSPVRIVSLWSGLLEVKRGKANVNFEVPYYNGRLRLMAVAASEERMGSAETNITVRDPLLLMPSVPRFLSVGDRVRLPVSLRNFTGSEGRINLEVEGSEGIEINDGRVEFDLKKEEEKIHYIDLKVNKFAGKVSLSFKASGNGKETVDSYEIPVIPPFFEQTAVHRIPLEAGSNSVKDVFKGWMPEYEQNSILVNGLPFMNALMGVKRLVRYPYGCVEQVSSATFPLLYVDELLKLIDPEYLEDRDIHSMVMKGISKVISMQQLSGGFSPWPSRSETGDWISVYATHMLIEAENAGYSVPQDSIKRALRHLNRLIVYRSYKYSKAYAYFVLALAGESHSSKIRKDIKRLRDRPGNYYRRNEELFLMGAALYLSGHKSEGLELI